MSENPSQSDLIAPQSQPGALAPDGGDDEISLLDAGTEHAVRAFLENAARQYGVTGAGESLI